jgi:F-type H+-transporting ATPase subunit epsilon
MSEVELVIVNPMGILLKEKSHLVLLPTADGQIGVLYNHVPTVAGLKFGVIKLLDRHNAVKMAFYIDGGMAQIDGKNINVICNHMRPGSELNIELVQQKINTLESNKETKLNFYKKILVSMQKL